MNKITKLLTFLCGGLLTITVSGCAIPKRIDIRPSEWRDYQNAKNAKERREVEKWWSGSCLTLQDFSDEIYWDNDDGYLTYKVTMSKNKDYSDPYIVYTSDDFLEEGITVPGKKYYYKVEGTDLSRYYISSGYEASFTLIKEGCVKIKNNILRSLNIDGMINNVRDLGGWKAGNKRVRYELVYRGPKFTGITEKGLSTMTDILGIKTELDLRQNNDRPDRDDKEHSYNNAFNYVEAPICGYNYIFPDWSQEEPIKRSYYTPTKESLYTAFKALTVKDNYPVFFHCNAGADRTGTFAFLLNGMLGVSIDDLALDFEMTAFSQNASYNHFRGPVEGDERVYGTTQDDKNNYVSFGGVYLNMLKWYGKKGGTLQYAIENYLTSFIGISKEDISTIKSIMLK